MVGNAFIIHGAYGNPLENWFPWLRAELERAGLRVYVPAFPTPENQTLENWLEVFKEYSALLDGESIMIGHSLGPAFIFSVLERAKKPIRAAFLVAPFAGALGDGELDRINRTFVDRKFDWERIRRNCGRFYVYASDNDPYVPGEKSELIADRLGATFRLVPGAGHFNKAAGYLKFPALLEDVKKVI